MLVDRSEAIVEGDDDLTIAGRILAQRLERDDPVIGLQEIELRRKLRRRRVDRHLSDEIALGLLAGVVHQHPRRARAEPDHEASQAGVIEDDAQTGQ